MNLAELKHQVSRFDPEIPVEQGWTPPRSWYRNSEFAELERQAVFGRAWHAVARAQQLQSPGDFVAGCIAGEPWVLTRNAQGTLRALSNVCRHKATQIAVGSGQTQVLQCRYHGWTYDLDGHLKTAPRMGKVTNFNREEMALPRLGVCTWGPLVLVNRDPNALSPLEQWAPLTQRLDASGWNRLVFGERRIYDLDCNWKVYCDNYLDGGYHVPSLHPGLAKGLDLDSYRTELFDGFSIQSCGGDDDIRIGSGALYAWIYPNLMLNRYGPVLDTNLVVPTGPESCRVIFDFYFDPTCIQDSKTFIRESIATSDQVQQEDTEVCESVQIGLGSSHYDRGRYAPGLESGIHQFHLLLSQDLVHGLEECTP